MSQPTILELAAAVAGIHGRFAPISDWKTDLPRSEPAMGVRIERGRALR